MTRFVLTLLVGLVVSVGALVSGGSGVAWANVLPDVPPEEQYRFALGRALQNDLTTSEEAYTEFLEVNKGHGRIPDAYFWLGRVQFMQGKYREAALTFSLFNSKYPKDARRVDTTMWVAESVSNFAKSEQACPVYDALVSQVQTPPRSFVTQMDGLKEAANCGSFAWNERSNDLLTELKSNALGQKVTKAAGLKAKPVPKSKIRVAKSKSKILPDVPPEEQYRFALGRALQNDLTTSEEAYTEFLEVNKGHGRIPDAYFWLGRVQFMQGKYREAALTFSLFNSKYPKDARRVDTTMWVAESVSNFAKSEQACPVYDALVSQVQTPPRSFVTQMDGLKEAANCGSFAWNERSNDLLKELQVEFDFDSLLRPQESIASGASADLKAAQRKIDTERQKRKQLEQQLAALEAKQKQQQKTISNDTQVPLITITQSGADGRKGSVKGYAKDNVQVAEVLIDGQAVRVGNDGSFEWSGFVPATGKEITIEAIDTAALSSTKTVSLKRGQIQQASGPRFDVLDPTAGKKVKRNSNALALIVGISDYERTDAPAVYADKDAQYFHDYASLKLGIPDSNIKTMVNAKAEQGDVILAVKDWMRRSSKPGKTDVYVFFAGHGLASDDGEQMYLLPYDGRPRLLDDTAILRDRLFSDIASANPRSVTVFLDTCYSGTTRGTDMLIASRPIAIKALEQSIPDNFTVMTAARGDQTAKPLEEAKHGMFSYFLMKGMEGEADQNQDNKITAGELHQYVQSNVVQQSSGSQTPELQGDENRVLVQFQ
ncbi:caspase family protein [Candidatus Puniceispirillum sp.]|nr:caspase family protein [Candidatus Puniceispirillum sp.]